MIPPFSREYPFLFDPDNSSHIVPLNDSMRMLWNDARSLEPTLRPSRSLETRNLYQDNNSAQTYLDVNIPSESSDPQPAPSGSAVRITDMTTSAGSNGDNNAIFIQAMESIILDSVPNFEDALVGASENDQQDRDERNEHHGEETANPEERAEQGMAHLNFAV